MPELYKKLYITLFDRVEKVMEFTNNEMVLKNAYDWDHTREILSRLQAALQECADLYIDSAEENGQ